MGTPFILTAYEALHPDTTRHHTSQHHQTPNTPRQWATKHPTNMGGQPPQHHGRPYHPTPYKVVLPHIRHTAQHHMRSCCPALHCDVMPARSINSTRTHPWPVADAVSAPVRLGRKAVDATGSGAAAPRRPSEGDRQWPTATAVTAQQTLLLYPWPWCGTVQAGD